MRADLNSHNAARTMSPSEQTIREQVEREFERGWDRTLELQGRRGEARLTEQERAQLMRIAMRGAVLWALVVEGVTILALIMMAGSKRYWPVGDEWMPLLNGPIFLVGYFLFRRQKLLNKAATMWRLQRQRLVAEEVSRRIQQDQDV